jgi:hypothetical protein
VLAKKKKEKKKKIINYIYLLSKNCSGANVLLHIRASFILPVKQHLKYTIKIKIRNKIKSTCLVLHDYTQLQWACRN